MAAPKKPNTEPASATRRRIGLQAAVDKLRQASWLPDELVPPPEQIPGWLVCYSSTGWWAVPAPVGASLDDARALPGRLTADTYDQLFRAVRPRYGWDDHCESCGTLARECGHRQPEREGARSAS